MKTYIYLLTNILLILFSCNLDKTKKNLELDYTSKIDSVVRHIAIKKLYKIQTENYSLSFDTVGFSNNFARLRKSVYYPHYDLTIEYRSGYDIHDMYEIIILIKNNKYYGILFNREKKDNCLDLSQFEAELNEALKHIYINDFSSWEYKNFQSSLTPLIIENISVYKIDHVYGSEIQNKINEYEMAIKDSLYIFSNDNCKEDAIDNLKEILFDLDSYWIEYYELKYKLSLFKIQYLEDSLKITVINECCFFEIIV